MAYRSPKHVRDMIIDASVRYLHGGLVLGRKLAIYTEREVMELKRHNHIGSDSNEEDKQRVFDLLVVWPFPTVGSGKKENLSI